MRRCYLVCYDIRDPKRLRRVHRVVRGYGEAWQFSVFFCVLKDIDRVRLERDLNEDMNLHLDQALMLDLGPNEMAARERIRALGQPMPEPESDIAVI